MKILVVSDTHGSIERVIKVYNMLRSEEIIDYIIHCGDYIIDAYEIEQEVKEYGTKVVSCYGNCDSGRLGNYFEILPTDNIDIFITHGDRYNVDRDLLGLGYAADDNSCGIAVFGHTHCAMYEEVDDMIFMNPGSLVRPRDGSGGTFGVIIIDDEEIYGEIYRYDEFIGQ